MTYLLDANACIHLLNGTSASLFRTVSPRKSLDFTQCRQLSRQNWFLAHATRSRPAENLRLIASFWEPFESLPFDDPCAEQYGLIRAELKRQGRLIGANDMLIAATALARDVTLITHNTREFARVPGLKLEDWETPAGTVTTMLSPKA